MKEIILNILQDSLETKEQFIKDNLDLIQEGADSFATCITSGHKIMIFGNGGSAADSQHIAAEFVNRFQVERTPLAALALTTDTSVITSVLKALECFREQYSFCKVTQNMSQGDMSFLNPCSDVRFHPKCQISTLRQFPSAAH